MYAQNLEFSSESDIGNLVVVFMLIRVHFSILIFTVAIKLLAASVTGSDPVDDVKLLISTLTLGNANTFQDELRAKLDSIDSAYAFEGGISSLWTRLGGVGLLDALSQSEELRRRYACLPFELAAKLLIPSGFETAFARGSGLDDFCDAYSSEIKACLLISNGVVGSSSRVSFASSMPALCPSIFGTPDVKLVALRHRLNKRLPSIRPVDERLHNISLSHMDAFELAVGVLNGSPADLRWGLGRITDVSFVEGELVEDEMTFCEWLEWASAQAFDPETGLFTIDSGFVALRSIGSLQHMSAFARMLALALMHGCSDMRVHHLPTILVSSLFEPQSELETSPGGFQAVLESFRSGFSSLVPLELFQELLTAAELVDALGGDVSTRPSFEVDDNLGAFFLALGPEFHGQPAEMCWIQAGGPQMLLTAMDDDENLRLLITTATNLNVAAGEELAFSRSIGFLQFCEINSNSIQRMLVSDRMGFSTVLREAAAGSIESAIEMGFAANLHLYCPAVVATLEMREVVLAHRLLRHFSIEADAESSGIAPLVRRESVFNDSIRPLLDARDNVRMGVARVTFLDENGQGAGVVNDWLTETIAQAFGAEEGLFETSEEAPYFLQVVDCGTDLDSGKVERFRAVGRLIALCLIEGRPLGVPLPILFTARLVGIPDSLDDIREDFPVMYNSLRAMVEMTAAELESASIEVDDRLVTVENRHEAIHEKIGSLLNESLAFSVIQTAFREIIPIDLLQDLLSPSELHRILIGTPEIHLDGLGEHVHLDGYELSDPQIRWLFNILHSFDQIKLRLFLKFVTASPVLPISGLQGLGHPISISRSRPDPTKTLPTASTCFSDLRLPEYASEDFLRSNLTLAIHASAAMGLA